jgi:hypothetical protein
MDISFLMRGLDITLFLELQSIAWHQDENNYSAVFSEHMPSA